MSGDLAEAPVHPPIETVPGGGLRYRLYDQDGKFVWLTCKDTPDMRRFVEWVRIHDRYGPQPKPTSSKEGDGV